MVFISPDDPTTVYYSEQEYEEIQLRKKHQEALEQAKREAQAQAEADIQAQKTKALTEFETGLESQVPTESSIVGKIAERERELRAEFESKLAEARSGAVSDRADKIKAAREDFSSKMSAARDEFRRQRAVALVVFEKQKGETEVRFETQLSGMIPSIKREYAMKQGTQFTPRQVRSFRQEQTINLQKQISAEAERLAADLEEQTKTFETSLSGETYSYDVSLSEWETSEKATEEAEAKKEAESFEQDLSEWRTQAKKDLGSAFAPWKEEQLKSHKAELETWETEAKAKAESDLDVWVKEENKTFEAQIKGWRASYQPKSFSEQILDVKPYFPDELRGLEMGIREVVKAGAGVIGAGESLVYGVGGLIGFRTPRMPPTVTGGLITSGIESVIGGGLKSSAELSKIGELGVSYALGSILGDVAISIGMGAAYQKFAPAPIKSAVTKVVAPFEKGVEKVERFVTEPLKSVWKGSGTEKWIFEHSDWYAKKVARGVAPSTAFMPQVEAPWDLTVKGGLPYSSKIAASDFAWNELMWGYERGIKMGRTSLVGLGAKPAATGGFEIGAYVSRSLPHLVSRGGQVGMGYLTSTGKASEPMSFESFDRALRSVMGSSRGTMPVSALLQPILEPKTVFEPLVKLPVELMKRAAPISLASEIIGAGAVASIQALAVRPKLKQVESLKTPERLKVDSFQIPALYSFQLPQREQRNIVGLKAGQVQSLKVGQIMSQIQVSIQSQLSSLMPKRESVPKTTFIFPRAKNVEDFLGLKAIPRGMRKTSKRKQEYLYPIRSVGSVAKLVFGKPKKKRK